MKSVLLVIAISLLPSLGWGDIMEANHQYCIKKIDSGNYGSAANQVYCHYYFDMAPAYLVRCLGFELGGFPTDLDKRACTLYLSKLTDLGPWYDYQFPERLKPLLKKYRDKLKQ